MTEPLTQPRIPRGGMLRSFVPTMPAVVALWVLGAATLDGCRPSDVLSVPAPLGVSANTALSGRSGAESVFSGEKGLLFQAIAANLLPYTEQLSDEFVCGTLAYYPAACNIDARVTEGGLAAVSGFSESGDYALPQLLGARTALLVAAAGLRKFEPGSGQSAVGEAFALTAYAELFMAEDYCAGVPLSQILPAGGYQFGVPLTTDSLLAVAELHFDSAIANAAGNDTVKMLASVGLGRTRLDRGRYAGADSAVAGVAIDFVYEVETAPNGVNNDGSSNMYAGGMTDYCAFQNMADREGGNGLNFVSARDPRLVVDSTMTSVVAGGTLLTCDGLFSGVKPGTAYYPSKFGANSTFIPLATGIEAALIHAEAVLSNHDATTWLAALNALRTSGTFAVADTGSPAVPDTTWGLGTGQVAGQTTGLSLLQDPGTDSARVSLTFRERAFWLFGTGTRLGDLRRLLRPPYNRDESAVYPTGTYAAGSVSLLPTYGTDVALTLPTPNGLAATGATIANPNYRGCLTSAGTA